MNFLAESLNFQTIQNTNIWAQEWLAVWQGARANRRETSRLSSLSAELLRREDGRALASAHVLPELCALSSQQLRPDVGTSSLPAEAALKQDEDSFVGQCSLQRMFRAPSILLGRCMACCTRWIVINSNNELTFQSSHLTSDDCNESVIKFLTLRVDGTTELIRYAYGKVEYIAPPQCMSVASLSVCVVDLFGSMGVKLLRIERIVFAMFF